MMPADHTAQKLAARIETAIERTYRENRWVIYRPEQFDLLGEEDVVLAALATLVRSNKLTARTKFRCGDGHLLPSNARVRYCKYCDEVVEDEDLRVVVSFELEDWFRQELEERTLEKQVTAVAGCFRHRPTKRVQDQ